MVSDRMAEDQSSWLRVRIGDVAQVYDGPHATPTKTATGPIFLGISALNRGRLDLANTEHLSEEDFTKWTKRVVPSAGDVVFSYETRIGEAAIIPKGLRCCLGRRMGLVKVDASKLDSHFFLYQYLSPTFQELLHSRTIHGSTVDRIALKDFPDFEIDLPPLPVQRQIAKVMLDVDAKIDLNRRINQTLEAMAQAIFKSWFVDFDPVKAKIVAIEQGQDPLHAAMRAISGKTDAELDQMPREHHDQLAATAALFPDAMEESELGEIPRGWRPTPIRDVAEVVKGKSYSSKDLVDNDQAALVTLKSFERGGGFRMDGFKPYVGPYKPEQVVLPGDLIVAYTDVTQAAELIGKPAVVVGVDHFKTLVASLDVGIIRPLNKRVSRQFLYGLFMTDSFQSHTFAHTSGTTVLHLAKEGVPSYLFACPDERLIGFFSETADAMAMEKQRLLDQNRSLETLRDTLLPKLLSGELSVADVDKEAALS